MIPRRIWVTRTEPQAEATARRLRDLGHDPVVAPVLQTRPIAEAAIDLTGVGALAFTSANGVAAFAALSAVRDLPVFTTGDATAAAAKDSGFRDVRSAGGDVLALADVIAQAPRPAGLLYPGALEPAADLVGLLAQRGVAARAVAVYATVETALAAVPRDVDLVLIHSPRAGRVVARLLAGADAARLTVLAISPAAAAPLAEVRLHALRVAPSPNEAALLGLLSSIDLPKTEDAPRRRGFGLAFWAMIALSAASILAGLAVATLGPRLFPLHRAAPAIGAPRLGKPCAPG
jgi:uroporphyrinogen-III synthase